jgi:protein O-mannosyl-transferase
MMLWNISMDDTQSKRQTWLVCLGLALVVLAVYIPLLHSEFVDFDDGDYVTSNDMVQHGVSWAGIVWAFSTVHASIWHPLTWISYQVDSQLHGMNPGGYHLTNVLLHLANSILLFLLLRRMTGELWLSALTAGFFALHPLHVESVAWVAERKDVLSTLFWLLSAWAYVRYTENLKFQISNFNFFYIGSIALFALGLMAKPMVLTLPFILLLLDYWPLQRGPTSLARLLTEKIPYFILAAGSCAATFLVARHAGAVQSLAIVPLQARLENVPVACVRYMIKTIWPIDLAVWYPFEYHRSVWEIAGSAALLVLISGWVLWRARAQPWCAVGWFWFLVMLAPVIGWVQVGSFSMADRYAYLSNTGLLVMVIWTARTQPQALAIGGGLALAGCLALTSIQVRYWHDSETLFRHALAVTKNNPAMENNLGATLFQKGRVDEALPHMFRAVTLDPENPRAHYTLAFALLNKGKVADALAQFEIQVQLEPGDPQAQFNFGNVLLDQGLARDAMPHLEKAAQLRPDAADYHYKLGEASRMTGLAAEAISQYEQSLQLHHVQAASDLAWLLATTPDASLRNGSRAVQMALLADHAAGGRDPKILGVLAAAYAEAGDFPKAVSTAQNALQLTGTANETALADLLRRQLVLYRAGSPFRDTQKP